VFDKIMVPVDLAHHDRLDRALSCAADLAKHYGATVVYVGVTSTTPSKVAHNPKEFETKLADFAASQGSSRGIDIATHTEVAHDPTADVDDALMRAVKATGADLVVMQSHIPDVLDYIWPSNGGKLAEHSDVSVMLVR
jgi:nucleotide-binding universal stress UspA family protein